MKRLPAPVMHALCAIALTAAAGAHAGALDALLTYPVPEYRGGMKYRTPDALDSAMLADVAQRMGQQLNMLRAQDPGRQLSAGRADIALLPLAADHPLRRNATVIDSGYVAAPMAIMRTDTDIKRWEHLKGRKVCLSEGGLYVGTMAAKYGAQEVVQRAPADSLLAVRIGTCDAAVHDSAMLEELVKLPEWKKFSARLPAGPGVPLAFVVPASDKRGAELLRKTAAGWKSSGYLQKTMSKAVQNIAFEVYLDQEAPDCH